ncbi:MAG: alpha/beta fold hydrolase [Actinoallomurus sp.]
MGDHRTVEAGGIRLAYRVSGPPDAPPLVLLHALGEDAADWDGVTPDFARHWRVYALDLRGHGRSDRPGDYSLELMRSDVLGFLDALALERVDLVGHSMGGVVAYLLAEAHPERVHRLVLEDVPAPRPRKPAVPVRPDGELPFDWEMVLAVRRQIDAPDPAWLEQLGEITAETLVLGGGPRSHVPQEQIAEVARRIPGGRSLTIPAGHLIHDAEPEAFVRAALRFLRPAEHPGDHGSGIEPLRTTFDRAASGYQSARPDYPDELYTDLLAITGLRPPARLLEVGCGPGKATLPLAREGFAITAVELGAALATQARRNLAGFPDVSVVTSALEEWRPPGGARFDLVYAATAWKWVDPRARYAKAAALLRPDGHLAVWNAGHALPEGFDPFFTAIQKVYDELGEGDGSPWPPPGPEEQPDPTAAEFAADGRFEVVGVRPYVWALRYTAEEYLALLDTFSGHIAMDPARRDHLYGEVRRLLALREDGRLTRHWSAVLTVGRLL